MARMTVMQNEIDKEVGVSKISFLTRPDRRILSPGERVEFPSKATWDFDLENNDPCTIVFDIDGKTLKAGLCSTHFIKYVMLKLCYDYEANVFTVKGILPKWNDLCRFRGLKFLGRDYIGRETETVITVNVDLVPGDGAR